MQNGQAEQTSAVRKREHAAARQTVVQLRSLRRAQEKLESELHTLQTRKQAIEARFAEESLPVDEITALGNELKVLNEALDAQEERWLTLAEEIERVEASSLRVLW